MKIQSNDTFRPLYTHQAITFSEAMLFLHMFVNITIGRVIVEENFIRKIRNERHVLQYCK